MADGEKKPPLSLNQLHNRFLLDRSASQSTRKPISQPSSSSYRVTLNDGDDGNEEVPRFDFDTPSPPLQVKSSDPHESHLSAKEDGEKPVKLKIEGRRRLCKISVNNESEASSGKTGAKDEEPNFEGISDFDSPVQVNKACESSGSEIRDILNDLSSRLEVLSIEKKMVPPKNSGFVKDCSELMRSKLYDVIIKDDIPENKSSISSSLLSSNSLKGSLKEDTVGGAGRNEHQKTKKCSIDVDTRSYVGMTDRTSYDLEGLKNSEIMRSNSEASHPYHSKGEKTYSKSGPYVALGERISVKQVNEKQEKIIELSDGKSDEDTLDDHLDDFTLSGLKKKLRRNSDFYFNSQ